MNLQKKEYTLRRICICRIQFQNGKYVILLHKEPYDFKDVDIIRANDQVGVFPPLLT